MINIFLLVGQTWVLISLILCEVFQVKYTLQTLHKTVSITTNLQEIMGVSPTKWQCCQDIFFVQRWKYSEGHVES